MQKLSVDLEYCYGISHLNYTFDFSDKNVYSIYAPNGSMKSSFAKVFKDLSKKQESCDKIFLSRKSKREILKDNSSELLPEEVFVIESYDEDYTSVSQSLLMVNKELKQEYDLIYASINSNKETFCKQLKTISGIKDKITDIFTADFPDEKDFFSALMGIKDKVIEYKKSQNGLENIQYGKIFNEKTEGILQECSFIKQLNKYMEIYDTLVERSTFFKKGIFNHNNAIEVAKKLKENNFFRAGNTINVKINDEKKELSSEEELETIIENEKKSIIENPDLMQAFNKIDITVSKNKNLKDFREYLEEHKEILPELMDLKAFKKKLWIAYFSVIYDDYNALVEEYEQSKEKIEAISQKAQEEKTEWQDVVDEFNARYSVPFEVVISNQIDVILSGEMPVISFLFKEEDAQKYVERDLLIKILSQGEKRALYILNIIFEIKAKIKKGQETLLIIDDIADSFDYKNKYAIIEYLKEISSNSLFKLIILTHNFDFYRNVSMRLGLTGVGSTIRKYRLHAIRTSHEIQFVAEKYQKNPFETWHEIENIRQQIALIPFLRNIAQYLKNENIEKTLTKLLHQKTDTAKITGKDLISLYNEMYKEIPIGGDFIGEKSVEKTIYEIARDLKEEKSLLLEDKIVLSIAIRLKAEKYMINKINDEVLLKTITRNQTIELISIFKSRFPEMKREIVILDQVTLMTSENIHLNSFMYEPILDMSAHHLCRLYKEICELT